MATLILRKLTERQKELMIEFAKEEHHHHQENAKTSGVLRGAFDKLKHFFHKEKVVEPLIFRKTSELWMTDQGLMP